VASAHLGGNRSAQRAVGGLDQRAGLRITGCLQPGCRRTAALVGSADQDGQNRQPLAGALVHPSLAVRAVLGTMDLGVADRTRRNPRPPAGGVLDRPLGDVEVERPHPQQLVLGVPAGTGDLDQLAGGVGGRARLGLQVLLPGSGQLRWQPQRVDARRERLDLGPEQAGQAGGDRLQAGEVQRRLPLPWVVHEQVADRPAP
jgi:hypothetical protein